MDTIGFIKINGYRMPYGPMIEVWRDVIGYDGVYMVSNYGRVISYKRKNPKILKPNIGYYGYFQVALTKDRVIFSPSVHRLVAESFLYNPLCKPEVNHKDGNKLNNYLYNLDWVTVSENQKHAFKIGLKPKTFLGRYGERHNTSKPIYQCTRSGEIIQRFESATHASNTLSIHRADISDAAKQKRRKTAGGFMWKYDDDYKFIYKKDLQ